ncbi:MAG: helix-turn-helix domain-containing protein [bacterium]|nr:helix-turn-helix domain-containing protein [bacterium]
MSNGPAIMTVKEVGEYLRLHESSIYRLSIQGKIPAYKVGRSWRFKKDKIDEWLHHSQVKQEKPFSDTLSDVH